jgi:hypothetical protein
VFPLFSPTVKIHPFVALGRLRELSPSAEGDQHYACWICGRFLKKATQKLFKAEMIKNGKRYSIGLH